VGAASSICLVPGITLTQGCQTRSAGRIRLTNRNNVAQDDFERPLTHCSDRHFFGQSSPAAVAREVFKPSTDAASRLVSIKKYFFDLGLEFS